jgi:uncharacterized membrane protein YfcA
MKWLSLLSGSIAGLSPGLTGGGTAVFAVRLPAYGMGVPADKAVALSLVSVGLTSFVGFLRKRRKGEAELRTGLLFALAGIPGAPLGAWIGQSITPGITTLFAPGGIPGLVVGQSAAHRLSASMLQRLFSVAILLVAVFFIVNNPS